MRSPPPTAAIPSSGCADRRCSRSCAHSEQAHRAPEKDANRCCVNQKSTKFWNPIFARRIRNADEERGDERAAQAAEAADGDDDQEVDQVLEGIAPLHWQDVGAERAAEAGEAAAER